jgi:hypothetical protein
MVSMKIEFLHLLSDSGPCRKRASTYGFALRRSNVRPRFEKDLDDNSKTPVEDYMALQLHSER